MANINEIKTAFAAILKETEENLNIKTTVNAQETACKLDVILTRLDTLEKLVSTKRETRPREKKSEGDLGGTTVTGAASTVATPAAATGGATKKFVNKLNWFRSEFKGNQDFYDRYTKGPLATVLAADASVASKTDPAQKRTAESKIAYNWIKANQPDVFAAFDKEYAQRKAADETSHKSAQLDVESNTPPATRAVAPAPVTPAPVNPAPVAVAPAVVTLVAAGVPAVSPAVASSVTVPATPALVSPIPVVSPAGASAPIPVGSTIGSITG